MLISYRLSNALIEAVTLFVALGALSGWLFCSCLPQIQHNASLGMR
jgi:hypothetical protein